MNSTSRGSRLVRSAARSPGALEHRARGLAQVHAELVRDDVRQRRLAEPRRAEQQHVVERFAALARRLDEDRRAARGSSPGRRIRRGRAAAARARRLLPARRRPWPPTTRLSSSFSIAIGRVSMPCASSFSAWRMPSATRNAVGQLLDRGDRFLVAVAEREQRVQDVARQPAARGGRRPPVVRSAPSLSFSSSSSRSAVFLPMPGILRQPAGVLHRHRLRELGDRQAREHRERGARADAGDLQQLPERAPLVVGAEAEEQVRVLAHDEVREQRHALAGRRQVVERAHRHVDLVGDALHVEQELRRILLEQGAGEAADHGRRRIAFAADYRTRIAVRITLAAQRAAR